MIWNFSVHSGLEEKPLCFSQRVSTGKGGESGVGIHTVLRNDLKKATCTSPSRTTHSMQRATPLFCELRASERCFPSLISAAASLSMQNSSQLNLSSNFKWCIQCKTNPHLVSNFFRIFCLSAVLCRSCECISVSVSNTHAHESLHPRNPRRSTFWSLTLSSHIIFTLD